MRKFAGYLAVGCYIVISLLSLGIYIFCLYLAYLTSFVAVLLTLIFPFIGQAYWIWAVWTATGVFFNPLTIACLIWLGLAAFGSILYASSSE